MRMLVSAGVKWTRSSSVQTPSGPRSRHPETTAISTRTVAAEWLRVISPYSTSGTRLWVTDGAAKRIAFKLRRAEESFIPQSTRADSFKRLLGRRLAHDHPILVNTT